MRFQISSCNGSHLVSHEISFENPKKVCFNFVTKNKSNFVMRFQISSCNGSHLVSHEISFENPKKVYFNFVLKI